MLKNVIFAAMLGMVLAHPQAPAPPPPGQLGLSGPPPSLHVVPSGNASTATVVKSEFVDDGSGTFRWAFETSDGFKAEQSGQTAPPSPARSGGAPGAPGSEDEEGGGETVKGSYSYTAPDGQLISVTYVADKNGFQPVGAHIPTPPPNPHAAAGAAGPGAPATGPGAGPGAPGAPNNGGFSAGSQSFASGPGGPPVSAQAGNPQNPAQQQQG